MQTIDIHEIHEAQTHLSELVDQAAKGEPFIITKAGKPMVKVVALDSLAEPPAMPRRLGFLEGLITVPEEFDREGDAEIERLFEFSE